MVLLDKLKESIGSFVILDIIPSPEAYHFDNFNLIRDVRKLEKLEESGEGKFIAWLGQGVIMNMSTRDVLVGTTANNDLLPVPTSLISKVLGEELTEYLQVYFENQAYFINGSII